MKRCHEHEVGSETAIEAISCKLQQGLADWNPNPLVPKAFQYPVHSEALAQAIADIAALARVPLEEVLRSQQEMICSQQEQLRQMQGKIERLEQGVPL